jgi:DMSO/TMAO reductase YedYZ molybdopterin-dependent catalytic subunit
LKKFYIILFLTIIILSSIMPHVNVYSMDEPKELIIDGLVENPMKISYNELNDFPQVWEVVELWCVEGYKVVKYNWTGVPLIYLLSKAKFKDGAKEVIFYASDGFTSSITLGEALEPTSILALEANGTNLSEVKERGGGYRIILPCRWGDISGFHMLRELKSLIMITRVCGSHLAILMKEKCQYVLKCW